MRGTLGATASPRRSPDQAGQMDHRTCRNAGPGFVHPIGRTIPDHREAAEAAVAASFRVMALTVFAMRRGIWPEGDCRGPACSGTPGTAIGSAGARLGPSSRERAARLPGGAVDRLESDTMSTGTTIATHASLPSQVAVRWCRLAVIVLGRSPGRHDRCRRLPRAQRLPLRGGARWPRRRQCRSQR